eukprot:gene3488-30246_t
MPPSPPCANPNRTDAATAILEKPELNLELAFVWNRSKSKITDAGIDSKYVIDNLSEVASKSPDLIIEVAHPSITVEHGASFLAIADYMVGSPTVFADAAVEAAMRAAATTPNGHGLYIPSGALWGAVDLQKMSERGTLKGLKITMKKHPSCFKLNGDLVAKNEAASAEGAGACVLYSGPVRALCPLAPNNVNTMAAAALAAADLGFDGTEGSAGDRVGAVTGNATYASFLSSMKFMNETLKYAAWAVLTVGLFYGDLGTDVALLVDLATVQNDLVLAGVVGGILILHIVVLSIYDLFAAGGLGLKGVILNLTFTRVLYIVFSPVFMDTSYDDAKRTGHDAKLLEALLESTPQLYVQGIVLIRHTGSTSSGSFVILIMSLGFSVLSIAFSQAMKLNAMLGQTASYPRYAGAALYFLADAVLRSVAFAAVFHMHGVYVAVWLGAWFVLDMIVIVYLSRFDRRSYRTKDIDGTGRDTEGTKAIANLQRGKEELNIRNSDTRIRNIRICKIPTYHLGHCKCYPMHSVVCYPFHLSRFNEEYSKTSDYNCLGPRNVYLDAARDLDSDKWNSYYPEEPIRCCDGLWCLHCTQCGTYENKGVSGEAEVNTINECWSDLGCLVRCRSHLWNATGSGS